MRLKIFVLMFFQCFILINEINSQLYLGAGFGIDNSNIVQSTNSNYFLINYPKSNYSKLSPAAEIKIRYLFISKLFIELNPGYTFKKIPLSSTTILGIPEEEPKLDFKFNYFQNSLQAGYSIKKFEFSIGLNVNIINNVNVHYLYSPFYEIVLNDIIELGPTCRFGYKLNGLNFYIYYNRGVYFSDKSVKEKYFEPINSFGAKLYYIFKIYPIKQKSKVDCPSFKA